jgi:hypothetical protein
MFLKQQKYKKGIIWLNLFFEATSFFEVLYFSLTKGMLGILAEEFAFRPNGRDVHNRRSSTCGRSPRRSLPERQNMNW